VTSDDERAEDSQAGGAANNNAEGRSDGEGDERMKELNRLRKLVKSRGAEAEEKQRRCQVMHMEIRKLREDKHWMENQVYRRKTALNSAAKRLAIGSNTSNSVAAKKTTNPENNTRKANGGGRPKGGARGGRRKKESEKSGKTSGRKSAK